MFDIAVHNFGWIVWLFFLKIRNEPGQWYFYGQKEPVAMEMASKSAMFLASLFYPEHVLH
jgi:hypothetical protein